MTRTKGQIRGSKSKGKRYEYDCESSLQQLFPDCFLTHQKGYIQEYDLQTKEHKSSFECKRLKAMSWNQAKAYLNKLIARSPEGYKGYLLFQSNRQPCLVMHFNAENHTVVMEFEAAFGIPFIKHQPIKKRGDLNVMAMAGKDAIKKD